MQKRVLLEQWAKNCPSWRVIWSYCGIIPKVVIISKIVLKTKNFVAVEQLHEPNVYHIKQVDGVVTEWFVNCIQLKDLHKAYNERDTTSDREMVIYPLLI